MVNLSEIHIYFNETKRHRIYINNPLAKRQGININLPEHKLKNGDLITKIKTLETPPVELLKRLKEYKYKKELIYYKE